MDENVPQQITQGLRLRGIDILTVQEDGRSGLADPDVIARATELERVLFSRDNDFLVIAHDFQAQEIPFSGVIYVHPQAISIGNCVKELELIAKVCDIEDCRNLVQFLPL
ncbi:MAG: DUF5615 family PIN-like protein [Cyanobacteria bacterium P01_G01_bin.54]